MNKIIITIIMTLFLFSPGYSLPDDENININGRIFSDMAQNEFVSTLASLLGDDIRGIWMMRTTNDGNIIDEYRYGNDGTLSGGLTSSDISPQTWGRKAILNGTSDCIDLGDSDNFSFVGAGALDHPFSIATLIYINDYTKTCDFFSKCDYGSDNREYYFSSNGWRVRFVLISADADNNSIGKRITAYTTNGWHLYVATYDGTGTTDTSGIKLYLDGVLVTATGDIGWLTYTGMANTTTGLKIGASQNGEVGQYFLDGNVAFTAICGSVISSENVSQMYELAKGFYGL